MTAALKGGEWTATRPGRTLPPGKTRYPFYRRLGGPQGRFGLAENLAPTGIRSRTVQPVAQSLYRLIYRAHTLVWSISRIILIGETKATERILPHYTLWPTKPTVNGLRNNSGLRSEILVTSRLNLEVLTGLSIKTAFFCDVTPSSLICRAQLNPDGTRWRTVEEVKGKHASGVGSQ
jgi:hypothetical protein